MPLAYECVRLGMNIECQDVDGVTPLLLAFQTLELTWGPSQNHPFPKSFLKTLSPSLHLVAKMLVEQHADVNIDLEDGRTPLYYACQAKERPLVEPLL